jgi:hypothetical protein
MSNLALTEKLKAQLDLAVARTEVDSVSRDAEALVSPLTEAQFAWRPEAGRWSVGECLQHLALSADVMLPPLEALVASARAKGLRRAGPFRYGMLGGWLVREVAPPARHRIKTTREATPTVLPVKVTVWAEFLKSQQRILSLLNAAEGLDLDHGTMQSPFSALVRYRPAEGMALLVVHLRRHLCQAEEVVAAQAGAMSA